MHSTECPQNQTQGYFGGDQSQQVSLKFIHDFFSYSGSDKQVDGQVKSKNNLC